MAILIRVNGNDSGEGFLIAPSDGRTFPVAVALKTDDGSTIRVTLSAAPNGAGLQFDTQSAEIGADETLIQMHATAQSGSRNDTILQLIANGSVEASATFNLTAITDPELWYRGRFEVRFATNSDPYNHPRGTDAGWAFALEGEPDFVPADSVPDPIDKFVGRVIRFHDPVAQRPLVDPIGVFVNAVVGRVGDGVESFTVGDPILTQPVKLGPGSYFAGNLPIGSGDPPPAEFYSDAMEPIANFEFHIGDSFSGLSSKPDDRPQAYGLPVLTPQELSDYGIRPLREFDRDRKAALLVAYSQLSDADKQGTPGKNLDERIAHLGGDDSDPAHLIAPKAGTLEAGYENKEEYVGLINDQIRFNPAGSAVIQYFSGFGAFEYFGKFFNFHSDELCARTHGRVRALTSQTLPPQGIYTVATAASASFNALPLEEMNADPIDAILATGSSTEQVVVDFSGNLRRLVISKATIENPGDAPAEWRLQSRGASMIGLYLPEASQFLRNHYYRILAPNDRFNNLADCEGSLASPAPRVGFARLFWDGDKWTLLLHAGTQGAAGSSSKGLWAGSSTRFAASCTQNDVQVVPPAIDFGNIEEGSTVQSRIFFVNNSPADRVITLLPPTAPFGAPGETEVIVPTNSMRSFLISFTAGAAGSTSTAQVEARSTPPSSTPLTVNVSGVSVPATVVLEAPAMAMPIMNVDLGPLVRRLHSPVQRGVMPK